ncbi:hypothetical protein M430DRAFT_111050 [Amorphotheca resinae ATCC 22711]|uniref:Uncharacterized protein n=1 Tax=Amorphotheca resinae ATCC 22711 TaxID=857342 RepID=A0A2T3APH1_AMORE|nr:hypothetical protein M430DRAFT_111050 [Amorphotheca resinae ATCC 22711]PSS06818.1 hypothetical protein M430DRAFT_111050 [Amorphotheca resinae ATCC 22711]
MPHPLRDPQGSDARRQVKQGEPFDPEELSRRLARLLAEQKSTAELRRDARAAKAAEVAAAQQNAGYHHVPKVAAAAFARTATPDVTRQIHELSRPALKQHLEGLRLKESHPQVTSLQRAQAMDQAMLEREMLSNRNQFQWTRAMEGAAEVDIERRVYKPARRSFIPEFAHLMDRSERSIQRPLSTGDFLEEDEPQALKRARSRRAPAFDGRNDWAQEEDGRDGRPTIEEPASPALKKRDSIWILKGRREKPGRPDKDEAVVGIGDFTSPDGSKSRRASFLARFRRRPS